MSLKWDKLYHVPLVPKVVSIQGQHGSFSHMTTAALFGDVSLCPNNEFKDAFDALVGKRADLAVIPVQNTIGGNVPYVHNLIGKNQKDLFVVGEYFLPVEQCLVTLPGADIGKVTKIHSHMHALAQCRMYMAGLQVEVITNPDTAGAAKFIAELGDPAQVAIAPALAADLYGLHVHERGIQDEKDNITRFLVFAREPVEYHKRAARHFITTAIIKPKRNTPKRGEKRFRDPLLAVLSVLEDNDVRRCFQTEYMGRNFRDEGIYIELVGHNQDNKVAKALSDMKAVASEVRRLGTYPTHYFQRFPTRARGLVP